MAAIAGSMAIVVSVIAMFVFVCWLDATTSGWALLAQDYRAQQLATKRHGVINASMGRRRWWKDFGESLLRGGSWADTTGSSGTNALAWAALPEGLHLKCWIMPTFHPPLLIPWNKVRDLTSPAMSKAMRNDQVLLEISCISSDEPVRLLITAIGIRQALQTASRAPDMAEATR